MAYVKWTFLIVITLLVAGFLHYTLPKHVVLRLVESEVRRVQVDGNTSLFWGSSEPTDVASGNREVKFVSGVYESGRPYVMRNEDTGWQWPPYFKFDSSDVQARAADLISGTPNAIWVNVTFYGWRSQLLTIYPNVLDLKMVDGPDVRIFPWFNVIFLTLLGAFALFVRWMLRRFWRNRVDPVVSSVSEGLDDIEEGMDSAQVRFRGKWQRFRAWIAEKFN